MKTLFKLLVIWLGITRAFGDSTENEDIIRTRFAEVIQAVVALDAPSLVSSMHPKTIESLARYFRTELERRGTTKGINDSESDESFVTRILADAFKISPVTFSFPTQNTVRVHGIVHDGSEAFLVYSTASDHDGFRSPATLTFRQHQGRWKLWSMPLARLAVSTWPPVDSPDSTPQVEQGGGGNSATLRASP